MMASLGLCCTAALACLLCLCARQCYGKEEGADISFLPNCTTPRPQVEVVFGSLVRRPGHVTVEYNCTHGNMSASGVLLNRAIVTTSTHSLKRTVSDPLPWGTKCTFSGSYTVTQGFVNELIDVPPVTCIVQMPADAYTASPFGCTGNCSQYSQCVNSSICECKEGLIGDGVSCFNISDCPLEHGLCYNCIGRNCSCRDGFELIEEDHGLFSCKDIDECATKDGNCQQGCMNTNGSYTCECSPGFEKLENGTCISPISPVGNPFSIGTAVYIPLILCVAVVLLLVIIGVLLAVVVLRRKRRFSIHKFRYNDDFVEDSSLPVDPISSPFIEPEELSLFDPYLPSESPTPSRSLPSHMVMWSSMPAIIDDIYRTIDEARLFPRIGPSELDSSRYFNHSDSFLVKQPQNVYKLDTYASQCSVPDESKYLSRDACGVDTSGKEVTEPRLQVYLGLPNREDEYVKVSYTKTEL